ncbi:protein serine/threonine phosphatase 2C [Basidiobolus meristosporus CBS 931.73]|uniref:Protein serine/threonine phosphatase 2C n=1 Tax=Basidiobolus meristosporus CBS 931.73 TaxID=1314790 RepID=A0A1Y1Y7Z6_9FUNG|nr:protein serine/threonine phosphatase 2C [Basidiobolus meristosporus CBS 931.73]|eukprot:ORX94005.1 protein serine/threonine phosphatase 2C [Basidiobolus meristosporus CBS 931.73]
MIRSKFPSTLKHVKPILSTERTRFALHVQQRSVSSTRGVLNASSHWLKYALGWSLFGSFGTYTYLKYTTPNKRVVVIKDGPTPTSQLENDSTPSGLLSKTAVDKRLRNNETAFSFPGKKHISQIEINQLASNDPIEDHHQEVISEDQKYFLLGVFDGHSGPQCSNRLSRELLPRLKDSLFPLLRAKATEEKVNEAIDKTFVQLDEEIVKGALEKMVQDPEKAVARYLPEALSGSCALVACLDTENGEIHVACTGDSRALLGRRSASGTFEAVPLSIDQTAKNEKERQRMLQEHPGEEETVLVRNRILGSLAPTRALGDSRYKWDIKVQALIQSTLLPNVRGPPRNYLSPPYVTAKPEIMHHQIAEGDEFLVLATDGLWDELTNDEVVNYVGEYLSHHQSSSSSGPQIGEDSSVKDSNVATHLIRSALGGKDENRVAKLLTIPAPYSRRFRDDITVTVVFLK